MELCLKIVPHFILYLQKTERTLACTPIGFNLKTKLITTLNAKFSNLENNKLFKIATLLDPRFKKNGFSNALAGSSAVHIVGMYNL